MPRFTVEMTSGGGSQMEVEAPGPAEAIKKVFYAAGVLEEYDGKNDPEEVYHGRFTDKPWQRLVVSISPPFWECSIDGCSMPTDEDGGLCDECTEECLARAGGQEEEATTYNVSFKLGLDLTVCGIEAASEEEAQELAQKQVDESLAALDADINECEYDDFEFEEDE